MALHDDGLVLWMFYHPEQFIKVRTLASADFFRLQDPLLPFNIPGDCDTHSFTIPLSYHPNLSLR